MTAETPARMIVVKKEEKEPRLRQLILDGLAAAACTGTPVVLRILAQSLSSPVARAANGLNVQLAAAGIQALVILAKTDPQPSSQFGAHTSWRHLADVRCFDAHELLVLGSQTAWTGDCLRREPATRDSYELHAPHNPDMAVLVARSFDRLWLKSLALEAREVGCHLGITANLAALAVEAPPQVLTRH